MSLLSAIQVPQSISNAIKKASKATGTDFSYLLKTAERESSFNKSAKAKSSSAAGLFQFIESTWLKTVKEAGNKFGLDKYTPHIFKTRSGRHYVPNQKLRQEILQLRHNPEISATMAGAFTQKNSEFIASELGREPSQGELYIAHFLGPKGASELISRADRKPNARADRLFPRAARANKSIFYSRGRPRSVSQVYKVLVRDHAKLQASASVNMRHNRAGPSFPTDQINYQGSLSHSFPTRPRLQKVPPIPWRKKCLFTRQCLFRSMDFQVLRPSSFPILRMEQNMVMQQGWPVRKDLRSQRR